MQLIEDIKTYNKINDLKKDLSALQLQKYILSEACSHQSQSLVNLAKLKSYGLTEDRTLELNNFLDNNGYKDTRPNTYASISKHMLPRIHHLDREAINSILQDVVYASLRGY